MMHHPQDFHSVPTPTPHLQPTLYAYKGCNHLEHSPPQTTSPAINSSETVTWQGGVCSQCLEVLKQETEAIHDEWLNGPRVSGPWAPQSSEHVLAGQLASREYFDDSVDAGLPPVEQFAADLRAHMQSLGYDPILEGVLEHGSWWGYEAAGLSLEKTEQKGGKHEEGTALAPEAKLEPAKSMDSDLVCPQEIKGGSLDKRHGNTAPSRNSAAAVQQHSMVLRPRNEGGRAQTRKR